MKINHLLIYALLTVGLFGCGGSSQHQDGNTAPPAVQRTLAGGAPQVVQADAGAATAVRIAGYRDNYTIARNQTTNVVTVTSKVDNSVTTYQNPSLIRFVDKWTSFDIDGAAGQVYRLYQAAFNRTPDLPGLGFWIAANQNGRDVLGIASDFMVSAEFKTLYGDSPANLKLINAFYNNVLHRDGEKAGIDWWAAQMENGAPANGVLYGFSDSAENKNNLVAGMRDGFDYEPYLPEGAIVPKRTSYANAKQVGLDRISLPNEMYWSLAYARADFKGTGKMALFATLPTYNLNTNTEENVTPSVFAFWSQAADGSWMKEPKMIDTPNGCVHPRKAVVADFNGDGKADVLVACTGYDGGTFPGEKMWMVMSTASGVYHSAPLQDFVGYFHSVAAADLDGDGSIDFVAVDPNSSNGLRMFMNKGNGTFSEVFGRFPSIVQHTHYYTVELLDINNDGKIDMLVGGHEWQDSPTIYVVGGMEYGFEHSSVLTLPSVADQGVVLDFLVDDGSVYIDRTAGGGKAGFYQSKVIQKIELANMRSSVLFIKNLSSAETGEAYPWFPWLLQTNAGIQSDNLHLTTPAVN
jgi:hypothetical protein